MTRIASQVRQTKIGGYHLVEKIGEGGVGMVYKGRDAVTGKVVAIKVMPEGLVADEVLRMRFAQECQVARKLDHPHIVRVQDFGLDGNKPFLVMEYVVGESLGQRIEREGRLTESAAVRVITQVGSALQWAHQRRIIHRDVKPDNILISTSGHAKLADMGLVKNLESDQSLTQTQAGLGTPNFMAPEQFADAKHADALCDLYSLAATLYMAVTGELPFRARNVHAVAAMYRKKVANEIAPPRELVPELSERLNNAILLGLRANRKERPNSVQQFLECLTDESAPVVSEELELVAEAAADAGSNKRQKTRFTSRRRTTCRALQRVPDKTWGGHVVNLSENGLCLELSRRFEPGALLTIMLEGKQQSRRSLVARVVWVKPAAEKTWKLGCQFDQPLCEFEIQELV